MHSRWPSSFLVEWVQGPQSKCAVGPSRCQNEWREPGGDAGDQSVNHPPGGSHHSTLSVPTQGVVLRVLIASASVLRKHKETFLYSIICCAKSLSHVQLCDPMDCSPPGSSVHGDFPGKNTGVGCHVLLQGIFQIQGLNPCLFCLQHCRWTLCPLSHQESLSVYSLELKF